MGGSVPEDERSQSCAPRTRQDVHSPVWDGRTPEQRRRPRRCVAHASDGVPAAPIAGGFIYTRILPCRVARPSEQAIRASQNAKQRKRMRRILARSAANLAVPGCSHPPAQVMGAGSPIHSLLEADGDYACQLAPRDGLDPFRGPEKQNLHTGSGRRRAMACFTPAWMCRTPMRGAPVCGLTGPSAALASWSQTKPFWSEGPGGLAVTGNPSATVTITPLNRTGRTCPALLFCLRRYAPVSTSQIGTAMTRRILIVGRASSGVARHGNHRCRNRPSPRYAVEGRLSLGEVLLDLTTGAGAVLSDMYYTVPRTSYEPLHRLRTSRPAR
jgi:hypothetical protein